MTIRTRSRSAASFQRQLADFRVSLEGERARRGSLLSGPWPRSGEEDPAKLREALDALRVQHEELLVAEEELRVQVDELTRMGLVVEAERERYSTLFEAAPDPYIVTDRDGVIVEANGAAARAFRIEPRFLRSKPLAAVVQGVNVELLHQVLDRIATDSPQTVSLTMRPRQGAPIEVEARVALTSQGKRLIWMLRQVEVRASTEGAPPGDARALRDKSDLLEREQRARRELERANHAKDRFIAILAHDLRSPLNAVLGWTQILQRETLDSTARSRAYATIERNARAQGHLIEELLDISRLAADKLQLSLSPLDLGHLVQRVLEGNIPRARELGLSLTHRCDSQVIVIGDRQRLEQMLGNLVSNALKYTVAGGHVHVEVVRDEGRARLTVRDDGKGISAALLPLVFEMYMQDSSTTARSGLGLGLHIVKQLVELHGGRVSVESQGEGQGAVFTVILPVQDDADRAAPSVVSLAAEPSLAGVRLLVVDDEEDTRELVSLVLRRAGADVLTTASAQSALEAFEKWRPDVVLSDIAMPAGDGITLIKTLRARDPSLVALAMSGFTSDAESERALRAGFAAHIGKPLDALELIEIVHEAVTSR